MAWTLVVVSILEESRSESENDAEVLKSEWPGMDLGSNVSGAMETRFGLETGIFYSLRTRAVEKRLS